MRSLIRRLLVSCLRRSGLRSTWSAPTRPSAVLTGILPTDDASCVAALNALLDKGAGAAVITLGGAGSVTLGDDGELLRMPALSSTVVDTTAAGDTFIGALAAARLEGLPLFECMAAGARASAVTVSRTGAQQSIPTRAEVEHWFG